MNTPLDLHKLLKLKKLESPGKAYFDHFPEAFQHYQRSCIPTQKLSIWEQLREMFSWNLSISYSHSLAFALFAILAFVGYTQLIPKNASIVAWQEARTGQSLRTNPQSAAVSYDEEYLQRSKSFQSKRLSQEPNRQSSLKQENLPPHDAFLSF